MTMLAPFVYWAQSEEFVFLKIDLKDVKSPDISLEERKITFNGTGLGAKGVHKYGFSLDFNANVNPEGSNYKVSDHGINFTIQKCEKAWWNRLISQPSKPAWLKIDFDKWQSEEDLDDNDDDNVRDIRNDYPDVYKKLMQDEKGFSGEDWRKVYLAFYNLFMFVSYMYVITVMGIRALRDGMESFEGTYTAVGSIMVSLTLIQFIEVLHVLFGYTRGKLGTTFVQWLGRFIVLVAVTDSEPRMQTKPVVFYLFVFWSCVEIVRYPFYITQIYKKENAFLTWLRYTIWIPLYPLGFLCEGVIMLRSIPYFEETGKYSLTLPNKYNFIFHFPMLLMTYLLMILPMIYFMMSHMYNMRRKKLGPNKWQKTY